MKRALFLILLAAAWPAFGADAPAAANVTNAANTAATTAAGAAPVASAGSMLQVMFGLIVVLGLMAGAAWMMRRMGMTGAGNSSAVKIIGGVNVGQRERVMVVEVGEQWIVVGVAAGRVNALSTMPRQEIAAAPQRAAAGADAANFASWLKQTIDKRNAR